MATLKFKIGTYGKDDSRENVEGVRVRSDPWVADGVELISITVDYADSDTDPEDLPMVQNNYWLQ